MSHAPFDGVLLDDARMPVPGAVALLLHLRVARRSAAAQGRVPPGLEAVKARAQACQELLAHGISPARLRGLSRHGLELGSPASAHSLASVAAHLEAYLEEVRAAGYLEPDEALWRAVDRHRAGQRGLWIERTEADGPIAAGLHDLLPARLRALACLPGLGGASFALATRKGDGSSGLFGSSLPLVEWLLDGLEQHGQGFPNEIQLVEPEGWGSAPWARALEGLFEGPLDLQEHQAAFRRGLVEGPLELLRHAVEQICAWREAGIPAKDITVIHPEPSSVAPFLAPLLAAEGIPLHVRGGLLPLIRSAAWSPLWTLLMGLLRLDPCAVSAGLRASQRRDLRHWADLLAVADQDGLPAFTGTFMHLEARAKESVHAVWQELAAWRTIAAPARDWAARLESLAGTLRLPLDSDDFFAPLGLLKEAWGSEVWTFREMLTSLQAFLEAARSTQVPRAPEGLRLVAPGTLLDEWLGARATLILDLSEGAWPTRYALNPDLDWNRKALINRALLEDTRSEGDSEFPAALQRFWLPRSEHGDQIPRAFQQEAYAFNKALALTREQLVVLSPAQDAEGRLKAQGPFWNALEGAGAWSPDPAAASSRLRWLWEGHEADGSLEARAEAVQARPEEAALDAQAPAGDRVPGIRDTWLKGAAHASPTALESLAKCPFRSLAERVWGLRSFDAASRLSMAVGILAHRVLEEALTPFVGMQDWPAAFLEGIEGPESLLLRLETLWGNHREAWLSTLREIPPEQWPQAALDLETLLPNLAAALLADAQAQGPTKGEVEFLYPERLAAAGKGTPQQDGWTRTLLALEGDLGPVELDLGNGRSLAVAGKIDRLERWEHAEGLAFLRVTDYKTSKEKSLGAYAEEGAPFASHLQTPLYMRIAEAVHACPATAVLVPLRDEEPAPFVKHLQALRDEGSWRERLNENLARFAARLEAGDFPPTPGAHCQRCELSALCGRPVDVAADGEED
jgi:hypothetical protein